MIALANHFSHAVPKSAVFPNSVISGNAKTSNTTPNSVIASPIKPMIANTANGFFERTSISSFVSRKTNRTDNIQFTNNPTQKPSAVASTSATVPQRFGNIHASNTQNTR